MAVAVRTAAWPAERSTTARSRGLFGVRLGPPRFAAQSTPIGEYRRRDAPFRAFATENVANATDIDAIPRLG